MHRIRILADSADGARRCGAAPRAPSPCAPDPARRRLDGGGSGSSFPEHRPSGTRAVGDRVYGGRKAEKTPICRRYASALAAASSRKIEREEFLRSADAAQRVSSDGNERLPRLRDRGGERG